MELDEAKQILKKSGYLVEYNMNIHFKDDNYGELELYGDITKAEFNDLIKDMIEDLKSFSSSLKADTYIHQDSNNGYSAEITFKIGSDEIPIFNYSYNKKNDKVRMELYTLEMISGRKTYLRGKNSVELINYLDISQYEYPISSVKKLEHIIKNNLKIIKEYVG